MAAFWIVPDQLLDLPVTGEALLTYLKILDPTHPTDPVALGMLAALLEVGGYP